MQGSADQKRVPSALLEELSGFGTATLHEAAGRTGALPGAIAPLQRGTVLWGRALPVWSPPGDNLALHRAIAVAQPGDVLVVDHGGTDSYGPFGDIMALAAQCRGIAGLVINGAVRDSDALIAMGFAVFSRGCAIEGTIKRDPGRVGQPLTIGSVLVHAGDAVIGDSDGVVVLPSARLAEIRAAALDRIAAEDEIRRQIEEGALTLDILGLRALLS